MPSIEPLSPPYDEETEEFLRKWMPPGTEQTEPLALFRLLARHPSLAARMRPLGAGVLGHSSLSVRERELLIARTTARAGATYEWGVHIAAFARPVVGLTDEQVVSTLSGSPDDAVWDAWDRVVLRLADELHDDSAASEATLLALRENWTDSQILEAVVCCGWYRLLSGVILTADLEPESWAEPEPQSEPASCCSTAKQSTCCDSAEKSTCCGAEATAGGGCGCQGG